MSDAKIFGFYIHYRKSGMPFYVGKGTKRRSGKFGIGQRNAFHKHIVAKDGRQNIKVLFVPCASESEALSKEISLIALYRSMGLKLANFTNGGEGMSGVAPWNKGGKHSTATKAKMSAGQKKRFQDPEYREALRAKYCTPEHKARMRALGRTLMPKGRKMAPDICAKISATHKRLKLGVGKKASPETKAKLSALRKAKWGDPEFRAKMLKANNQRPRKCSLETRKKLSELRKGKKHTPETIAKIREANLRRYGNRSDP